MTGAQLNCFKCHNLHKPIPSNPTLYWTLTQLDIIITYTLWSQLSTSICPPEITLPTSGDSLQTQTSSGYKIPENWTPCQNYRVFPTSRLANKSSSLDFHPHKLTRSKKIYFSLSDERPQNPYGTTMLQSYLPHLVVVSTAPSAVATSSSSPSTTTTLEKHSGSITGCTNPASSHQTSHLLEPLCRDTLWLVTKGSWPFSMPLPA